MTAGPANNRAERTPPRLPASTSPMAASVRSVRVRLVTTSLIPRSELDQTERSLGYISVNRKGRRVAAPCWCRWAQPRSRRPRGRDPGCGDPGTRRRRDPAVAAGCGRHDPASGREAGLAPAMDARAPCARTGIRGIWTGRRRPDLPLSAAVAWRRARAGVRTPRPRRAAPPRASRRAELGARPAQRPTTMATTSRTSRPCRWSPGTTSSGRASGAPFRVTARMTGLPSNAGAISAIATGAA